MLPRASQKSAALSGIWCAIGLLASDSWLERLCEQDIAQYNVAFIVIAAVFFLVPAYLFVLGRHEPFARNWFLNSEERARYAIIAKRMVVWFVAAGFTMAVFSLTTWLV